MPIYLDPRVIEGSLYTLDSNVKQHSITTLINGMEVAVLEHRLQDMVKEMKNLSVAFNTFKNDMEHSLTQHPLPSVSEFNWIVQSHYQHRVRVQYHASLKEVSPESGSSEEEESNGSKSKEDWQSAGEEGGDSGGVGIDSEGSGGDTWELFSVSGVRHDSI
jgi:hypothetical protein